MAGNRALRGGREGPDAGDRSARIHWNWVGWVRAGKAQR